MKYVSRILLCIIHCLLCISITSCVDTDEYDDTRSGNFDALWKIIDEHYCFFDYKNSEYGLDWNNVYNKYKVRVDESMSNDQLFEVLSEMLAELRDGHVNLSSSADVARYWSWKEDYPSNYADTLERKYLGTGYKIASGLKYKILDDNIGYMRYESFNNSIGDGNIDDVINAMMLCQGMIIDIRNNGGGELTNASRLACRFTNETLVVGYIQHKTGTAHNDFSSMEEVRIEPSSRLRWHKPVVLLTNRSVYSAANEFTMYMKCMPNVTIVGDKTGGGAGLPFSNSLPNGWIVRFSACPTFDKDMQSVEFGIEPDKKISLAEDDVLQGRDTIIEYARKLIASKSAQAD